MERVLAKKKYIKGNSEKKKVFMRHYSSKKMDKT
jgi:hypothetical protein